ncbi:MAG: hypothetical protein HXX14_09220 [Bacteroidetes bacterium]|nr:hypothetical protein [Bacteroidota bacterium]
MFIKKLEKLLCPTNGASKKEKKYLRLFKSLPSIERCTKCYANMLSLRVEFVNDLESLDKRTKTEVLDIVNEEYKILPLIHNGNDKYFVEKLKEFETRDEVFEEDETCYATTSSLFANVNALDRPKKKVIIYGTIEDICAKIGCFLSNAQTEDGHKMFEPSFLDISKYIALIAERPDGTEFKWKSLKGEFSRGYDYTLTIEKKDPKPLSTL